MTDSIEAAQGQDNEIIMLLSTDFTAIKNRNN